MRTRTSLAVLATATTLSATHAHPHLNQHRHSHTPRATSTDWFYAFQAPSLAQIDPTPAAAAASTVTSLVYATITVSAQPHGTAPWGYRGSDMATFPPGTGASAAYPTGSSNSSVTLKPSQVNATQSAGPTATAPAAPAMPSTLRGVNLGGWLILEKWMNSDCFEGTDAVDQWTFDQTDGAVAKLKQHWETYITENDIKAIAGLGLNAVRIPIGYWAYDTFGSGYITGADAYLERAIGWCRSAGLKVLVDCHGSPGSQNGFDNSGRFGNVAWQDKAQSNGTTNMQKSISILQTMARKYGAPAYADVVFGLELVNEPISWQQNNLETTKSWAQEAYAAVRSVATNKNLQIIMHDGFMGPSQWLDVNAAILGNTSASANSSAPAPFAIDTHLYQNQMAADSSLTQDQHIAKACNWTSSALLSSTANLPVYVGEFSAQTNICANPDGSTVAGSTCYIDGCQCSTNVDMQYWNGPLKTATRKFIEAELDAFERGAKGWFMWNYKGPGAWGVSNLVKYGVMGKVTERMFPGQCHFG
ncbi:hypothetical protein B0A48_14132 [Cryoendolithus antarcticus]|uniref:glucan 1,3-beta-glucosidase n=1 Tax=Cryoendolithus antarcticus TaxID=1507870 RepID=A0A1V8SLM7_9PEZI|nr:hypothetical protein B0A48_14132 [Cryoendolithus antarcticus]